MICLAKELLSFFLSESGQRGVGKLLLHFVIDLGISVLSFSAREQWLCIIDTSEEPPFTSTQESTD